MKFSLMKVNKAAVVVWVTLVLALVSVFQSRPRARAAPAEDGQSIYKAKCSSCHAADGSGNTAMGKRLKLKDLRSAEVQKKSDKELSEIIAKGKTPMQGYEKQLGKEKIQELVAYIRDLGKKH